MKQQNKEYNNNGNKQTAQYHIQHLIVCLFTTTDFKINPIGQIDFFNRLYYLLSQRSRIGTLLYIGLYRNRRYTVTMRDLGIMPVRLNVGNLPYRDRNRTTPRRYILIAHIFIRRLYIATIFQDHIDRIIAVPYGSYRQPIPQMHGQTGR